MSKLGRRRARLKPIPGPTTQGFRLAGIDPTAAVMLVSGRPMTDQPDIRLFSYGTLQQDEVQLATFGRRLTGRADGLTGYALTTIWIEDPSVVEVSGKAEHLVLVPNPTAREAIEGVVFEITREELAAADGYETAAYRRVEVALRSGATAWVYVKA